MSAAGSRCVPGAAAGTYRLGGSIRRYEAVVHERVCAMESVDRDDLVVYVGVTQADDARLLERLANEDEAERRREC